MSKLAIDSDQLGIYRIYWWIDEDLGGCIGEIKGSEAEEVEVAKKGDLETWECYVASRVAASSEGQKCDWRGFYWDTEKAARAAKKQIEIALRNKPEAPWPDWAVKAKAAGWAPPKGWKP